jgi:hypothetical protein
VGQVLCLPHDSLIAKAQPSLAQTHPPSLPDDQVIQHVHIEQLARFDNLPRHGHIFRRGCRVAQWMVICGDDGRARDLPRLSLIAEAAATGTSCRAVGYAVRLEPGNSHAGQDAGSLVTAISHWLAIRIRTQARRAMFSGVCRAILLASATRGPLPLMDG